MLSEDAFFTSSFTAIGLVPDSGTTWWLSHHLGVSRALEMALTNRRLLPDEAHELGLCLAVVPHAELLGRAGEIATQMADLVPDALVTNHTWWPVLPFFMMAAGLYLVAMRKK